MPDPRNLPRVALIAGPTASGKSAAALALAEAENGVVINADASQVYRDLAALTARPSPADEARAPHRLYGHVDGAVACSAAAWATEARAAIAETVAAGMLPILVGGTGLYFRTLLDGIAPVPAIDPAVRKEARALSAGEAHAALQREDPPVAALLHPNDTTRTQRALETIRSTGRSIRAWRDARVGGIGDLYRFEVAMFDPPPAALASRCDARVEAMFAGGAIEEVAALCARNLDPALPVMRAIGVRQIAAYQKGEITSKETIALIQNATRQYAKRQRTWFRNQALIVTQALSDRRNDG